MRRAQIYIFAVFVAVATARLNVEVMLHSYDNPSHQDCARDVCDPFAIFRFRNCDNIFTFCLRRDGSSSCIGDPITTGIVRDDDSFEFSSDILNTLGITNPLVFPNLLVMDPLELLITIDDNDIGNRERVDQILITFDRSLRQSSTFSPPPTPHSTCQRANITISYRITSSCPANMYGPTCSERCVDQPGQYYCNYLGERQCIGNFAPPQCETCVADYYPPNTCDTICRPRDDPLGHYTCDRTTGERICLPGFTNPARDCTESVGGRECTGNFAPPECDTCLPDYYPPNTCDTFCQPQDNSLGHYTCDRTTGERICLPGFTNVASDCTQLVGDPMSVQKSFAFKQSNIVVGTLIGLPLLALIAAY